MDRRTWQATVHGVAKRDTAEQLSHFTNKKQLQAYRTSGKSNLRDAPISLKGAHRGMSIDHLCSGLLQGSTKISSEF